MVHSGANAVNSIHPTFRKNRCQRPWRFGTPRCRTDHVQMKIVTRQLQRIDQVPRPSDSGTQPWTIVSFLPCATPLQNATKTNEAKARIAPADFPATELEIRGQLKGGCSRGEITLWLIIARGETRFQCECPKRDDSDMANYQR